MALLVSKSILESKCKDGSFICLILNGSYFDVVHDYIDGSTITVVISSHIKWPDSLSTAIFSYLNVIPSYDTDLSNEAIEIFYHKAYGMKLDKIKITFDDGFFFLYTGVGIKLIPDLNDFIINYKQGHLT